MKHIRRTRLALLLALVTLSPVLSIDLVSRVNACCLTPGGGYYSLTSVPASTQEGNTVNLVLTVTSAGGGTLYQFRFFVKNPASVVFQSPLENCKTLIGLCPFSKSVAFPITWFGGYGTLFVLYGVSVRVE